jgi:hypothetical protein
MFTLGSAKSSIIYKTNNGIIRKNEESTTMTNRKCKISIKEVHILIFYNFAQIGIALYLEHNKKSHNLENEWKVK